MTEQTRRGHWDEAYRLKAEDGVSWFEPSPDISVDLIGQVGGTRDSALIDIGGGASRLVDTLLAAGWHRLAVLDLSPAALDRARRRVGAAADRVEWIVADVTAWHPGRTYDIWHDRAAFHFLTEAADRAAYADRMRAALAPGGHAIIATFAPDGPERCSGLPVIRYDPPGLAATLGAGFELVGDRRHVHTTPWGSPQSFQFSVLRRSGT